jgi:uncharacterized membrane protein
VIFRRRESGGPETVISYILIAGVAASLILEIVGAVLYARAYGNLDLFFGQAVVVQGHDFFSFVYGVIRGTYSGDVPLRLMTAGIAVLILTPFVRVVFSVLYFAWEKDWKYVVITLFVLAALTLSLTLH